MTFNAITSVNQTTDLVVEKVASSQEYRYDRELIYRLHSSQIREEVQARQIYAEKEFRPAYPDRDVPQPDTNTQNGGSDFFKQFHIQNHYQLRSFRSAYRINSHQFVSNDHQISTSTSKLNASTTKTQGKDSLQLKVDQYDFNSHQIISLKGIRVNHKA